MTLERQGELESAQPEEREVVQTGESTSAQVASGRRAWYSYLNEDWLATIVGLLLVVLILVRLLASIP